MFTVSCRNSRGNKKLGLHQPLHPPAYLSQLSDTNTHTNATRLAAQREDREELADGGRPPYHFSVWEPQPDAGGALGSVCMKGEERK